jgi:hypothetical protein
MVQASYLSSGLSGLEEAEMKPIWAAKDQAIARQAVVAWWSCLLFAAVVLTIVQHALTLPRPFTYPHAWGAAAAVVDARAFRLSGIAALKAVPMHNNPPYGVHPEAYVHWPPLLALLLTFWFNLFGESETSTHAFTFALYLLTAGLLYWMIAANLGRLAAVIGTLSWLTLPVTLRYSHVILNETLGLPFVIFALMAVPRALADSPFQRRWQAAGAAAMAARFCPRGILFLSPLVCWPRRCGIGAAPNGASPCGIAAQRWAPLSRFSPGTWSRIPISGPTHFMRWPIAWELARHTASAPCTASRALTPR